MRATGTPSSRSRLRMVVRCAFWTSTTGDWPETVTDSSTAPTFISAFTVAVKSDGRLTSAETNVANP